MTAPEPDPTLPPQWTRVFRAAPAPLVVLTSDLVVVCASDEWHAATGTSPGGAVGRPVTELLVEAGDIEPGDIERGDIERGDIAPGDIAPGDIAPGVTAGLLACLHRAAASGRPVAAAGIPAGLPRPDGTVLERWWDVRAVPVASGDVALLVVRTDDVRAARAGTPGRRELEQANTELRALGERQQRTADVLAGLATTVSALAGAETRAELLRQLFGHGRAALRADLLAVALLEPGGAQLAVVDTRGPADREPHRVPLRSPVPMAVAAAGKPVFETGASAGSSLPFPGLRSWAALPLRAGRRPLGSVLIGWEGIQDFPEDDVRVLEAFAAECSQAVARVARLEAERRRAHATRGLAETLQRSQLSEPPRCPRMDIAVRYRPAAREAQVGGDWYDAFVTSPGETTLVVGDVTGHDWTAAAVAGQLRSMLRGIAVALEGRDLGAVLRSLDRAVSDTGMATLATAVVARVVDPPAGAPARPGRLYWSNAGHPPPLLVEPDGSARLLQRPSDLLLGVDPARRRTEHSVALRPGATLVLYTDGLVEHRDATLDDGLDRLLAVAGDLAARPVDDVCDEIIARLQPELTDDIALLALRVREDDARR